MNKAIITTVASIILPAVLDSMRRDQSPEHLSTEIAKEVAPIIENHTNSEPWYRSRVIQGILIAFFGLILSRLGLDSSPETIATSVNLFSAVAEAGGLLWALYGRLKTQKTFGA